MNVFEMIRLRIEIITNTKTKDKTSKKTTDIKEKIK